MSGHELRRNLRQLSAVKCTLADTAALAKEGGWRVTRPEPTSDRRPDELPVVAALRALSVFSADQAGAYREHFAALAVALGDDVRTKLGAFLAGWAESGQPGTVVLTGNAGTGKTAAAEAYCRALGAPLPDDDALVEVASVAES